MINREIIYERNLTGSYMKIPVGMDAGLDERLILRRKLPGLLPVEKAYIDGRGQYWYNISGRQSLDSYCRVRQIGIDFIERLIISICSEMEILEWNLIHANCLMLDPELVFITNSSREFIFTVYPCGNHCVETEFQQMMEYLLTKVDHKDNAAVRAAYDIYEKTLQDGFSILDIRDGIMRSRQETIIKTMPPVRQEKEVIPEKVTITGEKLSKPVKEKKVSGWQKFKAKLIEWGLLDEAESKPPAKKEKKREQKKAAKKKKADSQVEIIYPHEEIPVQPEPVYRPTVCLSSLEGKPKGLLLYQGREQFEDVTLGRGSICIGSGKDADVWIDRDTISRMHARIDLDENIYYIEDLNSTNGTFVNEEPLAYKERRKLKTNDVISFADIRYRFT